MNLARAKVEREGRCRVCAQDRERLEAAHVWPRGRGAKGYDDDRNIVPLCVPCHRAFDSHRLDLLPHLTLDEQLRLVELAGGIERARNRAIGAAVRGPEQDVAAPPWA